MNTTVEGILPEFVLAYKKLKKEARRGLFFRSVFFDYLICSLKGELFASVKLM